MWRFLEGLRKEDKFQVMKRYQATEAGVQNAKRDKYVQLSARIRRLVVAYDDGETDIPNYLNKVANNISCTK